MEKSTINTGLAFLVPTILAFIVWLFQRRINAKAEKRREIENAKVEKRRETEKALAVEKANNAEERRARLAEEHKLLQERVAAVEKQGSADTTTLALLRQEMLPMAEAMKRRMVDILTHPSDHFKIPDALLAKVRKKGASLPPELEPLLAERAISTDPHVPEQEKLVALALPFIVRLAELEAKEPDLEVTGLQLVTSTAKTAETKQREEGHGSKGE